MKNLKSFFVTATMSLVCHAPAIAEQSKQSAAESMLRNSAWSAKFETSGGTFYVDPSSRTKVSEGVYTVNVRLPARMTAGPFAWRDMPVHMQVYTIEVRCRDFQYKEIGWISRYSNRPRNVVGGGKSHDLDGQSIFYLSACSDDYLDSHIRDMSSRNNTVQILTAHSLNNDTLIARVAQQPTALVSMSNEQTCAGYGFKQGTSDFGQCLMQLDQAQRQSEFQQQQYQLQLAQYQQQVAVYNAQQEEIRREKNRRQGEILMRMSQGMLNSRSPSLLGGIADGFAAVNGTPIPQPVPPPPPVSQNYTIRTPNGNQVYCNYNSTSGYMSCR